MVTERKADNFPLGNEILRNPRDFQVLQLQVVQDSGA